MAGREVVLQEMCPGCADDGSPEQPLRTEMGTYGYYCEGKKHLYNDTGELRAIMASRKDKEKKELAPQAAVEIPAAPSETAVSLVEPKVFEVTDMDASRLGELLGQPVGDAGTLVGAVYALRMQCSEALGNQERRDMAGPQGQTTTASPFEVRPGGVLAVLIQLDRKSAETVFDKAKFNGVGPQQYVQDLLEYLCNAAYFPCDVTPTQFPDGDGCWIQFRVPEAYVMAAMDKAKSLNMDITDYIQTFVVNQMDLEMFP